MWDGDDLTRCARTDSRTRSCRSVSLPPGALVLLGCPALVMVSACAQGHYQRREGSSLVTVEGYIFMPDVLMDPENAVGFFSLVMATDDLPSEDYDVTKPGGK